MTPDSEKPVFTPKVAATMLGVSPSTLRRWAPLFAAHLSPEAGASGQARQYTEDDVALLAEVKRLLDLRVPIEKVQAHLAGVVASDDVPTGAQMPDAYHARTPVSAVSVLADPEVVALLTELRDQLAVSQAETLAVQRELLAELRAQRASVPAPRRSWWDWLRGVRY